MTSVIMTIITVLLFPAAFFLSHQGGADTYDTSMFLAERVYRVLSYFGVDAFSEEQVNVFLRASAHVIIYIVLTAMLCISLMLLKRQHDARIPICVGLIFCALCAWADEATKIFVEGRHFSLYDVGLNLIGCAMGYVIYLCIYVVLKRMSANVSRETF